MLQLRKLRSAAFFVSFVVLAAASPLRAQAKAYRYFRIGNSADIQRETKPGFALIGGGKDLDAAFQWMCQRAGGGDFLVLRATGTDAYNPYIQSLCHLNSVATLVIPSRAAANDPFVAQAISRAEAIFISGGDQANYINFWKDTPVQRELNAAIHRGVPVGGTSAGLAVQGEFIYSAQNDPPEGPDLQSSAALANPFHPQVVIAHGFLDDPQLRNTITDTHFVTRNRMGRLLIFMARVLASDHGKEVRGLGIDEQTAVLLAPDGHASVVGKGAAYFIKADSPASQLKPGLPLSLGGIRVQKVLAGGSFDLPSWRGTAQSYAFDVVAGAIQSDRPDHAIY